MAHISAGNSIYLYRLLKNELGVGHQASLARVEEALASDQIAPEDLDCADTTELLENLSEFIRITRFKGGRIFVTVVANAEYDTALEKSESSSEDKAAKRVNLGNALAVPRLLNPYDHAIRPPTPLKPSHRKPLKNPTRKQQLLLLQQRLLRLSSRSLLRRKSNSRPTLLSH